MIRSTHRIATTTALVLTAFVAACSDASVTAPLDATPVTPAFTITAASNSQVISRSVIGNKTTTVFRVGTATTSASEFDLGNNSSINFPMSASSICDVWSSSYGLTTWDSPCTATKSSVVITATTWLDTKGNTVSDFQPAMRFVPNLTQKVTLKLKAAHAGLNPVIWFRQADGTLINEALTDPSLVTNTLTVPGLRAIGLYWRTIKHFSGYTVTAD